MALVTSAYHPPGFLRNGHVQSIVAAFRRRHDHIPWVRERLELADGDFLLVDRVDRREGVPSAVITHGMEGNSRDVYVSGLATRFLDLGWNVVAWNQRGCGGEINRLLRAYHSGDTSDLRHVLGTVWGDGPVVLAGFSLGGNLTLKFLGEPGVPERVIGGAAVSAPVDLAACANALDLRGGNRIYRGRLLAALRGKVLAKAERFPGRIDAARFRKIQTFREFDDEFTGPVHGYRDAAEYWAAASSRPYLLKAKVPTLLLNALDDPFLDAGCFPFEEAEASELFRFEAPAHGGHLGFLKATYPLQSWADDRVSEFLVGLV